MNPEPPMDIAQIAATRRTAKAFDPDRRIPDSVFEQVRALLRCSPSSVNSQPWHFVVAATAEARERCARAAVGAYAYNAPKIRNASHVVALCVRADADDAHFAAILDQEDRDGRFPAPEDKDKQRQARGAYVEFHRTVRRDAAAWMERQVYLALGGLLLGAAALGLDACPMEGFDADVLAGEFGLGAQGWRPLALVALGFRSADDWNAALPKSRLPAATLFTDL